MSKLTEVSVQTMTFLLEVSADLSLEPGVLTSISILIRSVTA